MSQQVPSYFGVFGSPPLDLAQAPPGAAQFSPLMPGAMALEDLVPMTLSGMVMVAPPGTLERGYAFALCLRAMKSGAPFTAMAPNAKGGSRIAKELKSFGCDVTQTSRRHFRICETACPPNLDSETEGLLNTVIDAGSSRLVERLGLWSQPGIFSWDRIDAGTALLLSVVPSFAGCGADLGCGLGVLALGVLASAKVKTIDLVDIDRRAVAAARQNVTDRRARFHWADARDHMDMSELDFVVMNPPFHDGGLEDRALGQAFVRQSHRLLRAGGTAWLVANRHLPYESILSSCFSGGELRMSKDGYKVYEATK